MGTTQAGDVPEMLDAQMSDALDTLAGAVEAGNSVEARLAAIAVAQAGLDLQLRYRPPAQIDLARFGLWVRQLLVDAAAGDVASLEYIRDRFAHTLDSSEMSQVDAQLADLRAAADAEDLTAATSAAEQLPETLDRLQN